MSAHRDLMTKAATGDDDALVDLIRAHHDRVYKFGVRVCRDSYDADDAVQEAFIELAKRPDVARDEGVLSWLFRVVRNACLRMLRPFVRQRKALGERVEDADQAVSPELDPEALLERWRMVHAVHQGIANLARPHREVLVMRDLEGLSSQETCAALGLSLSTMKTRLHRAREALREEMSRLRDSSTGLSGVPGGALPPSHRKSLN